MAFYVDTGRGAFDEFDTLAEAREAAEHALDSARDFQRRMGWVPFWGRAIEIRRGKSDLMAGSGGGDIANQRVLANTKLHATLCLDSALPPSVEKE